MLWLGGGPALSPARSREDRDAQAVRPSSDTPTNSGDTGRVVAGLSR